MRGLACLLLVGAVLAVHWPGPRPDFVYDDRDFVEANQSIRELDLALAAFAAPFPPEQPGRGLYRPLTNLSYALDVAVWGVDPFGFHLTNIALYAAVVLLFQALATRLQASRAAGLAAAVLFAFHPVHCDAVDAIAGRSELLALLFSLTSLLLFLRARSPTGPAALGSAAAYALGCLSKESAAVLPAVLVVTALAHRPPSRGAGASAWLRPLRPLLPHLAVALAYAAWRTAVLERLAPEIAVLRGAGLATRLLTMGEVFLADLVLLVWPAVLQVDFYYQALIGWVTAPTAAAVLGWAGMAGLAAVAVLVWVRHVEAGPHADGDGFRSRRTALCGFALFFAFLLPTSHVLDIGALAAERFLFAPSAGFALLVVTAGRRGLERALPGAARPVVAALLVVVLGVAGAARSRARAAEWRDAVALWQSAERVLTDKRVHTNLAAAQIERGHLDAAREQLERALALDPEYLPALGNLGAIELEQGRLDAARATFTRLAERSPDDPLLWTNLGRVALAGGRHEEAARHFSRALALDPNSAFAREGLERARAGAPDHGR